MKNFTNSPDAPNLPPGQWISFLRLPHEITPEHLSQFFHDIFPFEIPQERIYVGPMVHPALGNRVVISFDKEMVRMLVTWILEGHGLGGYIFGRQQ